MKASKIVLPFKIKEPILALGPQSKNTICFAKGKAAYIVGPYNNLSSPKDFSDFEKNVQDFLKKHPRIIACDLHPEYSSSKYALLLGDKYNLIKVQHHHAHIASAMAENNLANKNVIGIAFDGTGLGLDNKIWGGEFFICNYSKFKRVAHLREIPLVGAERAIVEPWRLVAAWFGFDRDFDKGGLLKRIYKAGINTPLTSSMGRLFDAAASLVLGRNNAAFEAELAIALEALAAKSRPQKRGYRFKIAKTSGGYIIDPKFILDSLIEDLKKKETKEVMAWRFHYSVAQMIEKTCLLLRGDSGINSVVFSGGVFQNRVLLNLTLDLLYSKGFKVYRHRKLSCNDSSISLGEAAAANFRGGLCV
jgi:hydrogenase maturation protein HypF